MIESLSLTEKKKRYSDVPSALDVLFGLSGPNFAGTHCQGAGT